jgi:hypothetical protein
VVLIPSSKQSIVTSQIVVSLQRVFAMKRTPIIICFLFAIGSATAGAAEATQIPSGLQRGWIGITFEDNEAAAGIEVAQVMPNAPAQEAGLRAGDRIVRWNGQQDVAAAVRDNPLAVGDTVRLRLARPGEPERDLLIVAERRPLVYAEGFRAAAPGVTVIPRDGWGEVRVYRFDSDSLALRMDSLNSELRLMLRDSLGPRLEVFRDGLSGFRRLESDSVWLGPFGAGRLRVLTPDSGWVSGVGAGSLPITIALGRNAVAGAELTDITPGLSTYFGTDQGVLVLRVAADTPAARADLRDGDVIVGAGGEQVTDVAQLRRALSRTGAGTREIPLEVLRQGSRLTLTFGR